MTDDEMSIRENSHMNPVMKTRLLSSEVVDEVVQEHVEYETVESVESDCVKNSAVEMDLTVELSASDQRERYTVALVVLARLRAEGAISNHHSGVMKELALNDFFLFFSIIPILWAQSKHSLKTMTFLVSLGAFVVLRYELLHYAE